LKGYRFGLRQPVSRLTLRLAFTNDFSIEEASKWLKTALDVDVHSYQLPFLCKKIIDPDPILFLKMIFLTMNVLLQDLRVPVFQSVVIEHIEENPQKRGEYLITLWASDLESFPQGMLTAWLNYANQLLVAAHKMPENSIELENLYQQFHSKYIEPWLKILPGGKSTIPVLQTAWELGIPYKQVAAGKYILGWGSRSRWFDRSSNDHDSAIGAQCSHRKDIAVQIMKEAGLPTPKGIVLNPKAYSFELFKSLKKPWVVKPSDRDRGEGVTVNIMNEEMLESAITEANLLSTHIMVEEQAQGTCHRILIIEGQVAFVVKRSPRSVIGDGISTIEMLIAAVNNDIRKKIPIKRLPELLIDDDLIRHLSCVNKKITDIPVNNEQVTLRPVQSTLWGGVPEDVSNIIHPDNADIAIRAAALFNLSCAGVDLISADISLPWHMNNGVINEVNFSPLLGRTYEYQLAGIHRYLNVVFPTQGKIPIEVFIGNGIGDAVNERRMELLRRGCCIFLADDSVTIDQNGKKIQFSEGGSLFKEITMLRGDRRMQWLLVHIQHDDSFIQNGLPFEYVSHISCAKTKPLTPKQEEILLMLKAHLDSGSSIRYV
jgi:cyanophycin synthetase